MLQDLPPNCLLQGDRTELEHPIEFPVSNLHQTVLRRHPPGSFALVFLGFTSDTLRLLGECPGFLGNLELMFVGEVSLGTIIRFI